MSTWGRGNVPTGSSPSLESPDAATRSVCADALGRMGTDGKRALVWVSDDNPTRQGQLGVFQNSDPRYKVVLDPDNTGTEMLGEDIKDVEFSWPIGMPLVRSLERELWEVRSGLPRGQ